MQLIATEIDAQHESLNPPVDNEPPLDFHIGINENSLPFEYWGQWINDSRPRIDFYTIDLLSGIDYIEFSLDSGPTIKLDCTQSNAYTFQTSYTPSSPLSDGNHTITGKSYDNAANFLPGSLIFRIDSSKPDAFKPSAVPSSWTKNTSATITFSTTDSTTGVKEYKVSLNKGSFSVEQSPLTLNGLSSGVNNVTVRAYDWAGNYRDGYVDIMVDTTPPTLAVNNPVSGWFTGVGSNTPGPINGTAGDKGGSGFSIQYYIFGWFGYDPFWDGSKWVETPETIWLSIPGSSNWSYAFDGVSWQTGSYQVGFRAVDGANNIGTTVSGGSFAVDTCDPAMGIDPVVQTEGAWLKGITKITGWATDGESGSGISTLEVQMKIGKAQWKLTPTIPPYWKQNWEYDLSSFNWPKDTESTVYLNGFVTDRVGNTGSASRQFQLDTKAPASQINYPLNNSILKELNIINGTASDGGSGVSFVVISINRVKDDKYWAVTNWGDEESWVYTSGKTNWNCDTSNIPWESGTYILKSKAFDNMNDRNEEILLKEINITIDNTAPFLGISINNGKVFTNSSNAILTITAKDAISKDLEMSISTENQTWSAWEPYEAIKNFDLIQGDGIKNIYCRVRDEVDNTAYKSTSITLDTTPPVSFSPEPNTFEWITTSQPEITFETADSLSGIDHYELKMGDGDFSNVTSPFTPVTPLPEGATRITVRAFDRAGNYIDGFCDLKIDTTPPVNFIMKSDTSDWANNARPIITFSAVDNTSGLAPFKVKIDEGDFWIQYSPFLLPELNDGIHNITVRSGDNAGNNIDKSIEFKVDTTPPDSLSIIINNGASETNSTSVELLLTAEDLLSDIDSMAFSGDGQEWGPWEDFMTAKIYTLLPGDGVKTIYFRVMDNAGNIAEPVRAEIILNTTAASSKPVDDEGINDDSKLQNMNPSSAESNIEESDMNTTVSDGTISDLETKDVSVSYPKEEDEQLNVNKEDQNKNNQLANNELIEAPENINNNNYEPPADEVSEMDAKDRAEQSGEDGYSIKLDLSGAVFGTAVIIIVMLLSLFWFSYDEKMRKELEESKKLNKKVKEVHTAIRKKRIAPQKIYEAEIVEIYSRK